MTSGGQAAYLALYADTSRALGGLPLRSALPTPYARSPSRTPSPRPSPGYVTCPSGWGKLVPASPSSPCVRALVYDRPVTSRAAVDACAAIGGEIAHWEANSTAAAELMSHGCGSGLGNHFHVGLEQGWVDPRAGVAWHWAHDGSPLTDASILTSLPWGPSGNEGWSYQGEGQGCVNLSPLGFATIVPCTSPSAAKVCCMLPTPTPVPSGDDGSRDPICATLGRSASSPATSCSDIGDLCGTTDHLFWLAPPPSSPGDGNGIAAAAAVQPYRAYCAPGGWTLAAKVAIGSPEWAYGGEGWTGDGLFNGGSLLEAARSESARLPAFASHPGSEVEVVIADLSGRAVGAPLVLSPQSGPFSSLLDLFGSDVTRPSAEVTSLADVLATLPSSNGMDLPSSAFSCNISGFNLYQPAVDPRYIIARARVGALFNLGPSTGSAASDCSSADGAWGLGVDMAYDGSGSEYNYYYANDDSGAGNDDGGDYYYYGGATFTATPTPAPYDTYETPPNDARRRASSGECDGPCNDDGYYDAYYNPEDHSQCPPAIEFSGNDGQGSGYVSSSSRIGDGWSSSSAGCNGYSFDGYRKQLVKLNLRGAPGGPLTVSLCGSPFDTTL